MQSNSLKKNWLMLSILSVLLVFSTIMAGCGGGSSSEGNNSPVITTGTLVLNLTSVRPYYDDGDSSYRRNHTIDLLGPNGESINLINNYYISSTTYSTKKEGLAPGIWIVTVKAIGADLQRVITIVEGESRTLAFPMSYSN